MKARGGETIDGVVIPVQYQCPHCLKFRGITKDRRLRKHRVTPGITPVKCKGSGMPVDGLPPRLDNARTRTA